MKISPFDVAAETYDKDFTRSKIGLIQRQIVWKMLIPLLQFYPRPLNILEINCGTGEDAFHLASLGHHVIATDASEQMIERANEKLYNAEWVNNKPTFITCSFDQLATLNFKQPFDLVISNFGGLNCIDENEMIELSNTLSSLVTDHGQLLLVVLGKCCVWEMAYYTLKGNFSKAFRRFKRSVPFRIDKHSMNIYYYSPSQLFKLFSQSFIRFKIKPVGFLIPPSYLESAFAKRPRTLARLNRWEKKLGLAAFAFLADHYCVILNKNKS